MLTNYVVDGDLKKYYPLLSNWLWTGSADYSAQINEAFALLQDDLRAKGLQMRKLGVPIDLLYPAGSTSAYNTPASSVDATSTSHSYVEGHDGYTRLVTTVTAGTGSLVLEGSNDQSVNPSSAPSNWTTVATIVVTAAATQNTRFVPEYKYYRIRSVVTTALTFYASLNETRHERALIYKAFELIFSDFSKNPTDVWAERKVSAAEKYLTSLESLKLMIDTNDDNLLDKVDEQISGQVMLGR